MVRWFERVQVGPVTKGCPAGFGGPRGIFNHRKRKIHRRGKTGRGAGLHFHPPILPHPSPPSWGHRDTYFQSSVTIKSCLPAKPASQPENNSWPPSRFSQFTRACIQNRLGAAAASWTAPAERSGDGAFLRENFHARIRRRHLPKRGRASLAPAVQKLAPVGSPWKTVGMAFKNPAPPHSHPAHPVQIQCGNFLFFRPVSVFH